LVKDAEQRLLYLSSSDVEALGLGMTEIVDAVEAAFREKGDGRAESPPKAAVHPARDALIHAMPASLSERGAAGMKWVSSYPQNRARGLPAVYALVVRRDDRSP
jgi:ornithine cyclodeaminase/alanine dehydrogenase-like protein (mu-crystallin family)